jgi:tRNA pseudouridine65 synthase
MKHIHHHLIGDTKHGRGEHNQLFREKFDCHRLLLHAQRIAFEHPVTQEWIDMEAPLDNTFSNVLKALFPKIIL